MNSQVWIVMCNFSRDNYIAQLEMSHRARWAYARQPSASPFHTALVPVYPRIRRTFLGHVHTKHKLLMQQSEEINRWPMHRWKPDTWQVTLQVRGAGMGWPFSELCHDIRLLIVKRRWTSSSHQIQKVSARWIKDLHAKSRAFTLLVESMQESVLTFSG